MWDDAEDRKKKKIRKAGKNAAMTAGAGVALWIFTYLYPQNEGSEKVIPLLRDLAPALILYGIAILAALLFKRERALAVYTLLTWLVLPAYAGYLLMSNIGS